MRFEAVLAQEEVASWLGAISTSAATIVVLGIAVWESDGPQLNGKIEMSAVPHPAAPSRPEIIHVAPARYAHRSVRVVSREQRSLPVGPSAPG